MKVKCPKCASFNTYGGYANEMACMMCGKRWYPERKVVMSKIAVCTNCGRETSIVAKGLCGVCYTAVHGKFDEGSPEYDAALKKAKERCTGLVVEPKKRGRVKAVKKESSILDALKAKRHELMDQVTKINQAIEVIEAL